MLDAGTEPRARRSTLPLFPLEVVLFPGMSLPLHIFEPRYRQMIGECLAGRTPFGVLLETAAGRAEVGCSAEIVRLLQRYPDGRLDILTEGRERFRVAGTDAEMPYLRGTVEWQHEPDDDVSAERARLIEAYRRTYWAHGRGIAPSALAEAPRMSFVAASSNLLDNRARQRLLEAGSERERLGFLADALERVEPTVRRLGGNGHGGR